VAYILLLLLSLTSFSLDLTSCYDAFLLSKRQDISFPYQFKSTVRYSSKQLPKRLKKKDLKLGTFNLENFVEDRDKAKRIMSSLVENDLDIVVLQEA
jgi:hypothetical protein